MKKHQSKRLLKEGPSSLTDRRKYTAWAKRPASQGKEQKILSQGRSVRGYWLSLLRHQAINAYVTCLVCYDYRAHSFLSSVSSTKGSSIRFIAKSLQRILFERESVIKQLKTYGIRYKRAGQEEPTKH